jgi:two-component system, cell cycle sensor histidine kinase and response regulator CckA
MSTRAPGDRMMTDTDVDARTAEALRRAEVQLRQTLKMEAVGRLAGGIAHDVNNLMTVVTGYAELLLDELQDRPRLHQMTAEVKRAADRGTTIARQLLAFSRKQMLSPSIVSLSETVSSMESSLADIVGKDIELLCAPSDDPCRVYVDASQIEQVLVNLATNAREAMAGGGRLSVSVSQVELNTAGAVRGPEMPQGPYVALRVSDTGCGMDLETQAKIFEPFFTTKPRGQGLGLGLATVYGTVKQSGGFIYCDSAIGVGTTFTVYLPAVDASVQATSVA